MASTLRSCCLLWSFLWFAVLVVHWQRCCHDSPAPVVVSWRLFFVVGLCCFVAVLLNCWRRCYGVEFWWFKIGLQSHSSSLCGVVAVLFLRFLEINFFLPVVSLGDVTPICSIFVFYCHRLFASCESFGLIIFADSKKKYYRFYKGK